MAWHYAHASVTVVTGETEEHGSRLREFWLVPETHDWVEVYVDVASAEPRTLPYQLDRLLVTRGPVGELLGQEFAREFPGHDDLVRLQGELDGLRAGEDETRWTADRRARIQHLQRTLNDRVYASPFPHLVVVTVYADDALAALEADFNALTLPRRRFVAAIPAPPGPPTASRGSRPAEGSAGSPR